MNESKNNARGIFYGVIGVATLVVAIIGATFAYFTATASNNVITGNMATVSLSLAVTKVTDADEAKGGMIPMSNGMVEQAVNKGTKIVTVPGDTNGNGTCDTGETDCDTSKATTKSGVCIDDNGNAVCQIYKITITNSSTAAQFVDGYVALRGGSGQPTDLPSGVTYKDGALFTVDNGTATAGTKDKGGYGTTMRWVQVFETATEDDYKYTTAGTQTLGTGTNEKVTFSSTLGDTDDAKVSDQIRYTKGYMVPAASADKDTNKNGICDATEKEDGCTDGTKDDTAVLTSVNIAGNYYDAIGTNYIRISNHAWATGESAKESYKREDDITSALVFNHSIPAKTSQEYYVAVWLSETGTNQTPGATAGTVTNPSAAKFFLGNVTFISAQGSEVSATFSGYSRVQTAS